MAVQNPFTGGSAALSAVPEAYQPQALENLQQQRMAQLLMAQGQQEAMHNAMLQQQQQYNNQSANIAGQPSGLSRALAPMQQMMMARALRQGGTTPQGAYAQQGQYMQDATNNPMTQQ
jgi:hypothetical protein